MRRFLISHKLQSKIILSFDSKPTLQSTLPSIWAVTGALCPCLWVRSGNYPRVEHPQRAALAYSFALLANIRLGWTNTSLLCTFLNNYLSHPYFTYYSRNYNFAQSGKPY
jgi:hypothetical protein